MNENEEEKIAEEDQPFSAPIPFNIFSLEDESYEWQ